MPDLAVEARDLHKSYRLGKVTLDVLRGVSFRVAEGEFISIVGASGSGKSTLLHLAGLLDRPDSGTLLLEGTDTRTLSASRRNAVRRRDVGFVFQFYHLLPELNVLENVLLPAMVDETVLSWAHRRSARRKAAREVLERMGLGERLRHRPQELSGGERQRVALARALVNRPRILLADEPTGNLDSRTGGQILDLLHDLHAKDGLTLLMVTHDPAVASRADRALHLRDGKLVEG